MLDIEFDNYDWTTPVVQEVQEGRFTHARELLQQVPVEHRDTVRRTVELLTHISL